MMKRFAKIFLIMLIICISIFLATKVIEAATDYDWSTSANLEKWNIVAVTSSEFEKVVTYSLSQTNNCSQLQGFCVTPRHYVFWAHNGIDGRGYLFFANVDNPSNIVKTLDLGTNVGHMNDMTYNPNTDEILALGDYHTWIVINDSTMKKKKTVTAPEKLDGAWGVSYDKVNNQYIFYGSKIHFTDDAYNITKSVKSTYSYKTEPVLVAQGIGANGKNIFYGLWEPGYAFGDLPNYNSNQECSNLIAMFNYGGEVQKYIYIPRGIYHGEIETIDFDSNGDMFIGMSNGNAQDFCIVRLKHDIKPPTLKASYSTKEATNGSVTVTITSTQKVQDVSGWTLSTDQKTLTKTYSSNVDTTVTVKDLKGNQSSIAIKIANIDKTAPSVTITRKTYKSFKWTAKDSVGVTGYQITTTSTKPELTDTNWITTGTLTSGTYSSIDTSAAGKYYVWAKDAAGNISAKKYIAAYLTKRTQGTGTTLTTRVDATKSTEGTEITSNTAVLNGTSVWAGAVAKAGYNTIKLQKITSTETTEIAASGGEYIISATTRFTSSATANTATITIKKDGSNWSDSGINVALYSGTTSKYAYSKATASGATVVFSAVTAGTYNVYASRTKEGLTVLTDTGVDVTVSKTGTAAIDYYTLTSTQGANTTLDIKLDSSTGTIVKSTTQVLKNTKIYAKATGASGYTAALTVGGTATTNGSTQKITAKTTIESKAVANKYTVTYDKNAEKATGTMTSKTATFNSNFIPDTSGFTRTGYTFVEWNEKRDRTGTVWQAGTAKKYDKAQNITLYAQWTANEISFKNQTKAVIYSEKSQSIKIAAATNGTGSYTYTEQNETKDGLQVDYMEISGTNIKLAAGMPEGTYVYEIKAKDTETGKTKIATYTITVSKAIEVKDYEVESSMIEGIKEKTTIEEFNTHIIKQSGVSTKIVNKHNVELQDGEKLKTGDKLQVITTEVIAEYAIVITGDVDGDGKTGILDIFEINRHRLNKKQLEGAYLEAADVTKDGKVKIEDILKINTYRLGKIKEL